MIKELRKRPLAAPNLTALCVSDLLYLKNVNCVKNSFIFYH